VDPAELFFGADPLGASRPRARVLRPPCDDRLAFCESQMSDARL